MQYKINHVEDYKNVIDTQADKIHDQNNEIRKCKRAFKEEVTKLTKATVEASNTIVRQAHRITQLEAEKAQLTEAYNELAIKQQSTERQLESIKVADDNKKKLLDGFYSERNRVRKMAVVSPDRHFDSKPRKELW